MAASSAPIRALVRLNGYSSEEEMLADVKDIGKKWYVEPTRRDEFQAILRRDGYVEDFISEVYRDKTRERIWISESARRCATPRPASRCSTKAPSARSPKR